MQEPIALPPPGLRSGVKAALRLRILTVEGLTDEQALIAMSLLALSDGARVDVSAWVASQLFDCAEEEWRATVAALAEAGLVTATWANEQRVDLVWRMV